MMLGEETASVLAAERKAAEERAQDEYILVPKLQRGRPKIPTKAAKFFRIGLAVENSIPTFETLIEKRKKLPERTKRNRWLMKKELLSAGFSEQHVDAGLDAKTPKIAARRYISDTERLYFPLVAEYHRKYLRIEQSRPIGPAPLATDSR